MTAIASISSDLGVGRVAAVAATPIVAVQAPASASPDKNPTDPDGGAKPVAISDRSAPLQARTVTLSDVTTGLLIQADQDPKTGATVSQFPDRALLESYAQQIRLQDSEAITHSLNT